MGGRASTGNRNRQQEIRTAEDYVQELLNSNDYIGDREIEQQINDSIRYHLPEGAKWGGVISINVISNPGGGDFGDVEAEYELQFRIPVSYTDVDGYAYTEYEYETEYRTEVFQVRVRKRG